MVRILAIVFVAIVATESFGQTSIERGKVVFDTYCLACHQADGSGVPMLNPPLIKSAFVDGDKTKLIGIVLNGLQGVEVNGDFYDNPMPPFNTLTDVEIADVLTFVKNNFQNKPGVVKKEEVAKVRSMPAPK
jgi:mono/diheme cytochrome c family protein